MRADSNFRSTRDDTSQQIVPINDTDKAALLQVADLFAFFIEHKEAERDLDILRTPSFTGISL
jgi:hypothetical protein